MKNTNNYQDKKEEAREEAREWIYDYCNHSYSYGELLYFQNYFEKLAKRYGLIKEFKENCII